MPAQSDGAARLALVTGAAHGIGRAFARRLADDGARLALVDLQPATEIEAELRSIGAEGESYVCDVSDPDAVSRLAAQVAERQGRVDILVNNVGVYPLVAWEEMTFERWRRVQSINVDSLFLMTKAFVPGMLAAGWGRVVNVSSGSAWMPLARFSAYVTSKAAVVGYTRGLAAEVGGGGVTVNAIAPSLVRTPGTTTTEHGDGFDAVAGAQVIKRVQETDDLVGTLSWLASDAASFVTAQTLSVDGGLLRL